MAYNGPETDLLHAIEKALGIDGTLDHHRRRRL